MRILAVDPGEVNLGIAISDPSGTIASPLTVLRHTARQKDAAAILRLAAKHNAGRIVVGQSLDEEGRPTLEGRRAARLAGALRALGEIPVELWDEANSTQAARQARRQMGVPRHKRRGHLDDLAATVILQSYLEARSQNIP